MFSLKFAPDPPEWLLALVTVLSFTLIIGMLIWALFLEIRYISPFTIIKTSNKEKWRRATILAFLNTAMIPVLGLIAPILSPQPDQWPIFPLFCGGIWILVLPAAILFKRWEFERRLKYYQRIDKMIKDKGDVFRRTFASPFVNWTRIFMTAEQKRFFSEGYSENVDNHH